MPYRLGEHRLRQVWAALKFAPAWSAKSERIAALVRRGKSSGLLLLYGGEYPFRRSVAAFSRVN